MTEKFKMAADKSSFTLFILLVGIIVHVVYLASIFDIYFTSPLVHGMEPFKSSLEPPAKRLVLFVADGLRADKFYEMDDKGETRAPFLRGVIESKGCWGVSHTRVPTESRPGHVALIAGFYEDVSAVAKGWKENPVEFDSAFNESRYTWAWGSPDILPMFAKGATEDHVFTSMYPAGMEDFADTDASKLDAWVFDEVKQFFVKAHKDYALGEKLAKGNVILFLHLLGIDTNGHAHRPTSDEYLRNIAYVDQGIKTIVTLVEDYFNHDEKTAYIMTADHGMTNWGSHGAGHAHETLTPLVAWGAGIRGPVLKSDVNPVDDSKTWALSHLTRSDVNQADIAPLMTSLIGVPFPLNSVGILPVEYLNNTAQFTAENLFTNARQILAQYQVKEEYRRTTSLLFRPFKLLTGSKQVGIVRDIKSLLRSEKYNKASNISRHLMDLALEGLNYYQNYDRVFLNTVVTLGFLGWIVYIVLWIVQAHTDVEYQSKKLENNASTVSSIQETYVNALFISVGILAMFILAFQSAPFMYYVYCLLPILFWNYIGKRIHIIWSICSYVLGHGLVKKLSFTVIFGMFSLEILVISFFQREILCVGLVCFTMWILSTKIACHSTVLVWMSTSAMLAVFPMLPVVGRDANYSLVTVAGLLTVLLYTGILLCCCKVSEDFRVELVKSNKVLLYQFASIFMAIYNVNVTASSLKQKKGLPLFNQVSSWIIFFSSFVVPLFSSRNLVIRITSITLALTSAYLLMSTAYEGLFLLVLSLVMSSWILCEHKLLGGTLKSLLELHTGSEQDSTQRPTWRILTNGLNGQLKRPLTLEDLRCSYFFVFFIITAFFGTGNIASLNSFDPSSVYCFLTVFSPFVMGSLLLCKVFIPFVIVTSAFDAVHIILRVPVHSLFLVVLVLTDIMGLHFFYFVKDYGSWLEIGTSISHYVIMMTFIIFLFLIFGLTRLYTGALIRFTSEKKES